VEDVEDELWLLVVLYRDDMADAPTEEMLEDMMHP